MLANFHANYFLTRKIEAKMRLTKFCKLYDISKNKVERDAKLGLIDLEKVKTGKRILIEVIENEKLLSYEPRNNRRPHKDTIRIKNNPAWIYRNDLIGQYCSSSLNREINV